MKKNKKVVFIILLSVFSLYLLINYHSVHLKESTKMAPTHKITDKIQSTENNRFDELKQNYTNDHIVAFLDIPGVLDTPEPILQTNDNEHYLSYNINEERDINGATYLDYRIDVKNTSKILIYGHSNPTLTLPLAKLAKYADKDFYNEHPNIYLYTKDEILKFTIFSSYVETNDFDYLNLNNFNGLTWMEHLEKLKKRSQHVSDITLQENKKVIILQTCSFEKKYQNYKQKYRLVMGIEK